MSCVRVAQGTARERQGHAEQTRGATSPCLSAKATKCHRCECRICTIVYSADVCTAIITAAEWRISLSVPSLVFATARHDGAAAILHEGGRNCRVRPSSYYHVHRDSGFRACVSCAACIFPFTISPRIVTMHAACGTTRYVF
jgi:hypothetical protein